MAKMCSSSCIPILKFYIINYVRNSWRDIKVMLMDKDLRPISLSFLLFKIMERIIDCKIRSFFTEVSILKWQHAYMKCSSVDTALHEVFKVAEMAIFHKQFALAVLEY